MVKHHHYCLLYVMYLVIWMLRSVIVSPTVISDLQRTATTLFLSDASFEFPYGFSRLRVQCSQSWGSGSILGTSTGHEHGPKKKKKKEVNSARLPLTHMSSRHCCDA